MGTAWNPIVELREIMRQADTLVPSFMPQLMSKRRGQLFYGNDKFRGSFSALFDKEMYTWFRGPTYRELYPRTSVSWINPDRSRVGLYNAAVKHLSNFASILFSAIDYFSDTFVFESIWEMWNDLETYNSYERFMASMDDLWQYVKARGHGADYFWRVTYDFAPLDRDWETNVSEK